MGGQRLWTQNQSTGCSFTRSSTKRFTAWMPARTSAALSPVSGTVIGSCAVTRKRTPGRRVTDSGCITVPNFSASLAAPGEALTGWPKNSTSGPWLYF
ncbi:hypothetical protein D3C86_2008070 [compost metagenome]